MEEESDRVRVQTYVPAYQKEIWADDANQMGTSQSEFVRMMVQAGRKKFDLPSSRNSTEQTDASTRTSGKRSNEHEFKERVLEMLSPDEPCGWDDLIASLTDDIEEELAATLESLQEENVVRHSGPKGGYVLRNDYE